MTQETKDIIEKEALELYPIAREYHHLDFEDLNVGFRVAWRAGATKYAEKIEDLERSLTSWIKVANEKDEIIEQKDQELSRLKVIAESLATALTYYEEGDKPMIKQGLSKQALTAYAKYCKEK